MSGGSSWRSPSTADQYCDHDYADFAQEFLNRNRDYRQDHADAQARIAEHPSKLREEQEGLAGRWGLCFPHRSRGQRSQIACTLVARDCARCRDPRRFGLGWCDPASTGL
ncbi:transcriptional regulator domain-containing protein [Erythrobacter sp.]|uniref:transcriptional regulator domain-containing protein n=1 Tax=Erythrobacter sp. TaxID=1042 RepID=UPI00311DDECF